MYPPRMKSWISGQCDILVLATNINQNVKKGPLSHQEMKCLFLDYIQFPMISQAIQAINVNQNVTKGPLSHQKMKCLFVDYIQFLIMGQEIQEMNVDQNAKKAPKSS